ncbi:hypothetical protein ON010_g17267 [Phytophthora cinnamomi]|nr:hypothetical protein ON010_g17267 [Phytophthora cinnamomi]
MEAPPNASASRNRADTIALRWGKSAGPPISVAKDLPVDHINERLLYPVADVSAALGVIYRTAGKPSTHSLELGSANKTSPIMCIWQELMTAQSVTATAAMAISTTRRSGSAIPPSVRDRSGRSAPSQAREPATFDEKDRHTS